MKPKQVKFNLCFVCLFFDYNYHFLFLKQMEIRDRDESAQKGREEGKKKSTKHEYFDVELQGGQLEKG